MAQTWGYPTAIAKRHGYDQVLWTDCLEHKWLQEVGTMNVFFIIGNKAITPSLEEETILEGVTRNTVISILNELGFTVEERKINIDEVIDAYKNEQLAEVFGTGTAATISPIKELKYRDFAMYFDTASWKTAPQIKKTLAEIRDGKRKINTVGYLKYDWRMSELTVASRLVIHNICWSLFIIHF